MQPQPEPEPERGPRGDGIAAPEPLAALEQRLRTQEQELTLVKAALADALRRLGLCERHLPLPPDAAGAVPEPHADADADPAMGHVPPLSSTTSAGPPHSPAVSVATQTELEAPGGGGCRGGPTEPAPPGSPPCPPPASPEPPPEPPAEAGSAGAAAAPSPALRGPRKELLRRNSSSDKPDKAKARQRLSKKAASAANLLLPAGGSESRLRDPSASPGPLTPRRSAYNLEGTSIRMFLRGRPITMYIPSGVCNYEELRTELPARRLQLDWVYGYRGRDSRSNLYVLASGELVYFIACAVVLYHVAARRQRHYLRHTDCVRCLSVHPDRVRVATGQAAGVDKDGKDQGAFLCVVDDSNEHMMSVWDCARGTKQAEVKSTNESVLTVEFNPQDSGSIVTGGKSHVYFWTWSGAALTKKQGVFGKYKKPKFIQCFIFDAAGDVLTGDSEGNILTWSRAAGQGAKETYRIGQQTRAHEGSVFALRLRGDGSVLSGGGKDRRLRLWSPALALLREAEIPERFGAVRTIAEGAGDELLVGTTRNALLRGSLAAGFAPIVQGHTDELWGLATHPSRSLFLTCGHDRQLCVWDSREHALAWSLALEDTGLCADFHPGGHVVAVGLQTGRWLVLDAETRQVLASGADGSGEQLSVVRYSPDGEFLAVGSHDNVIYIYGVGERGRKYSRFGRCAGHSSFITHLDWSKDSRFIMSNSGDYEILYWDVAGGCKLLRNRFESRDREWATYTCVLGFHVFGVWPDGSDGTDINSLCRSHDERVVAVADDFCKVHLFQYPCARAKAPSHVYGGHGSHVTNVRFSHDDAHLVSLGGKDTSIFQWRVLGGPCRRSLSADGTGTDNDGTGDGEEPR
ncbi:echinoderm microtubule-associated protein-like 3 isoform X2 [Apteryx mantelli]|uniref:Echinoderm microtubule-associated protein-like 3 isoform X2 n=1 Tax=Apteryx mantelli TaxID=2696672 RepID=A0ABM4G165_9AVES